MSLQRGNSYPRAPAPRDKPAPKTEDGAPDELSLAGLKFGDVDRDAKDDALAELGIDKDGDDLTCSEVPPSSPKSQARAARVFAALSTARLPCRTCTNPPPHPVRNQLT